MIIEIEQSEICFRMDNKLWSLYLETISVIETINSCYPSTIILLTKLCSIQYWIESKHFKMNMVI